MEGEREGEKHQCKVASGAPPTGDLAHNPGMCPNWELNWRHFGLQPGTQSTEPHQPGLITRHFRHIFLILFFKIYLFIFIQLQLSAFSPLPSTPPQPVPPPSPTSTLPLDFVLVSFIVAPIDPSPH